MFFDNLDEATQARVVDWVVEFVRANSITCKAAEEKLAVPKHNRLETHALSLVMETTDAEHFSETTCFILRWEDVATRLARRVRIEIGADDQPAVVFQLLPVEDHRSCKIIINNVGVKMDKEPKPRRPILPNHVMLRWEMQEAQLFAGPILPNQRKAEDQCAACMALKLLEKPFAEEEHDLFVCCACLSRWHLDCSAKTGLALGEISEPLTVSSLGTSFTCSVCCHLG